MTDIMRVRVTGEVTREMIGWQIRSEGRKKEGAK